MYSVCRSPCRCSLVCVRHSIFYVCVTCGVLDVTIRLSKSAGEKARGNNDLSYAPSKRRDEIKSGTFGSFDVPYFQPATSTDRLHIYIVVCVCVCVCVCARARARAYTDG